jgi:peptide chain release factor subunit 1
VATITEDMVRALVAFRGTEAPVTTCYLDVDGRNLPTHRELQHAFDSLVKRAGLNGHGHQSVSKDVARMGRHVRGLKRSKARGLAMFSCTAQGFWEVHELPMPVTSQLVVHDTACVQQLEDVVDRSMRIGLLVTDRQRARLFVYELGEVVERSEADDPLERQGGDDRGELVKTRVGSQRQQQARQHVKHAAQHAFDVLQSTGFDWLVIGAPTPDVLTELEQALHPYVRDRVVERLQVPIALSEDQLTKLAADAEDAVERRTAAALVARLRDGAGSNGASRAVYGLDATLAALCARRVDRLVVSRGFAAEGWRCGGCGCLAVVGRRCPGCSGEMRYVSDVVEAAVHETLTQNRRVTVLIDSADLDVLGRIGALLRF